MNAPKSERNIAILKLHDMDPKKYSFGVLGGMFNITRVTAHEIYHREKLRIIEKPVNKNKVISA